MVERAHVAVHSQRITQSSSRNAHGAAALLAISREFGKSLDGLLTGDENK
jgi:hypothetical protein